ncbi:hypothetical protein L0P54_06490 [Anaerosalibacter bizertensis]|nr:hypothetical protein [Bacteroidales bacterium MSK.15.36]MCG4582631.1 hypothetical protein [Anaerosalibacter bizertensis]MCG4585615.1 hypothetical protein [Anaerosalibacter bizertensis]
MKSVFVEVVKSTRNVVVNRYYLKIVISIYKTTNIWYANIVRTANEDKGENKYEIF